MGSRQIVRGVLRRLRPQLTGVNNIGSYKVEWLGKKNAMKQWLVFIQSVVENEIENV